MRPLSLQVTTKWSLWKYKHCLNVIWDNLLFHENKFPKWELRLCQGKNPHFIIKITMSLVFCVLWKWGNAISTSRKRRIRLGVVTWENSDESFNIFGSDDWGKWENWWIVDYPQIDWEHKNISSHASSWAENRSIEIRSFSNQFSTVNLSKKVTWLSRENIGMERKLPITIRLSEEQLNSSSRWQQGAMRWHLTFLWRTKESLYLISFTALKGPRGGQMRAGLPEAIQVASLANAPVLPEAGTHRSTGSAHRPSCCLHPWAFYPSSTQKENRSQSWNKNYSRNRGCMACHRMKTKPERSPHSESVTSQWGGSGDTDKNL